MPNLVTCLERQLPDGLRRVAAAVAVLAVQRTRLNDQRLEAALGALREGRLGETSERTGVECAARELDEIAWAAQEKAEAGDESRESYLLAFRRARGGE